MSKTKICKKCNEIKSVSKFHCNKSTKDRLCCYCKSCVQKQNGYRRQWRREHRFHVALANSRRDAKRYNYIPCITTPEALVASFTGYCAVCKEEEGDRHLGMDHCHKTGKFRGWLCEKCNKGAGLFRDSPELLERMAAYLRRNF